MQRLFSLLGGALVLLLSADVAWSQAALERLEKRLQKPAKPVERPGVPAAAQPRPPVADDRPAPRELEFKPGYLGAMIDERFDPDRGVRIVQADAAGPADLAGLLEDDLIVGVNGRAVKKMADLARVLERSPPGAELTFDIERNGEKLRVAVTLGERPAPNKRLAAEFGRQPEGNNLPAPDQGEDPLQLADERQVQRPGGDRLRQLEQRMEQLEQRLARIEELLRERP